ncbi:efflux RND transporter periplasmic adaptor subunit [Geosporobacter ferrireducens]|uniref:efflux RND transporter periplasmic adaptor subunit n=1 Tax=Geosporobacter ferrireducens TaxID=1424294 RepID=UPI00139DE5CC|nr:HlyD family efflux transporter periplasmic adaptor subunit [Geosporobacter ferrireducens]MTI53643.1 HlyD family efflux transporter periplasmic adaptor subunit [Geosporobacter ferrireducens]
MKKFWSAVTSGILLLSLLTGCAVSGADAEDERIVKPVAVMTLREESRPVALQYTGRIEAKELIKYSFKTSGRIGKIFVEEGQSVKKGDPLALLEQEELNFALQGAKAQMDAAKAQYDKAFNGARAEEIEMAKLDADKAQEQYEFVKEYYEKAKALYDSGGISEQHLKEAKLQQDQAKASLEQVQKVYKVTQSGARIEELEALYQQYEVAKANFNASEKLLEDALILADCDGYVVGIPGKAGEIAGAGYPVVVIGSAAYKGRIGLTQEDISKVDVGSEITVFINEQQIKGRITTIGKIPDEKTQTYPVDIALDHWEELSVGTIIKVSIPVGEENGIWVPVQYILNDGEDYVFIVEGGRAKRKNVQMTKIQEDKVLLEGLQEGEILITEGIKGIKDGYAVAMDIDFNDGVQ